MLGETGKIAKPNRVRPPSEKKGNILANTNKQTIKQTNNAKKNERKGKRLREKTIRAEPLSLPIGADMGEKTRIEIA